MLQRPHVQNICMLYMWTWWTWTCRTFFNQNKGIKLVSYDKEKQQQMHILKAQPSLFYSTSTQRHLSGTARLIPLVKMTDSTVAQLLEGLARLSPLLSSDPSSQITSPCKILSINYISANIIFNSQRFFPLQ